MSVDWPKAIQILAIKEVLAEEQSSEFDLRSIARWYSKTFATPLHLVYTLPTFDVLQAYYEEIYETLSKDENGEIELKRVAEELCKTDEELKAAQKEKDRDEVEFHKMEKDCIANNTKKDAKDLVLKQKQAKLKIERDKQAARQLDRALDQDSLGAKIDLNAPIPAPEEEIEEFKVDFTGLDDIGDLDGLSSLTGLK